MSIYAITDHRIAALLTLHSPFTIYGRRRLVREPKNL